MTNEQKQDKSPKEKRLGEIWGMTQARYLAGLQGRVITVAFLDGTGVRGTLTGVDTFDIFLERSNGQEIMIPKHAIKYLRPAGAVNDT